MPSPGTFPEAVKDILSVQRTAAKTLETLEATENLAAFDLWLELLLTGPDDHQDRALAVLLGRKNREALYRIVTVFHRLAERHRWRVVAEGAHLSSAVRRAYLDLDPIAHQNACELIRLLPDYDQAPLLLGSLTEDSPLRDETSELLQFLIERLTEELALEPHQRTHHDIESVRRHFLETLATGLRRYSQHKVEAIPTGLLALADVGSKEVLAIFGNSSDPGHAILLGVLRRQSHPLVLRWVYALLAQPDPPAALLNTISRRDDAGFVEHLLDNVGMLANPMVQRSLRRVTEVKWLAPDHELWRTFNDARQAAAVIFCIHTGLTLEQKLATLAFALDAGDPGARRAAACALAQVPGADANHLVVACLDDEDPAVALAAIMQLRRRRIPGALTLLIKKLDHPDRAVRQAARDALADYRFDRFLSIFDRLSDRDRLRMGSAILRIDPNALATLREQLRSTERNQRMRAVRVARLLKLSNDVVAELVWMLGDRDQVVRREATDALAIVPGTSVVEQLHGLAGQPRHELSGGAKEALEHLSFSAPDGQMRAAAKAALEALAATQ